MTQAQQHPPAGAALIEEHQIAGVSLLLQIVMLGIAFVLGHVLRRRKFYYLHEAGASLLIGECLSSFGVHDLLQKSSYSLSAFYWHLV
ncbi:hypothetical protein O6H91_16G094100 [Diphasiastrum complanatum]|uniref:Uncharacterized protein n=1 Tax=Diphasiastrum complanatum TaxID=34168 RepID=A0ACC2BF28_DIPCM|nr:hypothetical protein O6H91_Y034000 [Diphasiastrum complanatum]KAJ7528305.1 hypothetical protein O6H91_16G094100 [Diphasiastrum complanatum]